MRVLQLLTALGHGGAEIWLLNMLKEFDRAECALDFCLKLPQAGKLEHVAVEHGAKVFHVPLRPTHVGYLAGLTKLLRSGAYDVLHTHEFVYSGLGVAVAKATGVPSVSTFHHWQSPPETRLTRMPVLREVREVYGRANVAFTKGNATILTALSRKVMNHMIPDWRQRTNTRMLSLSAGIPPLATEEARRQFRRDHGMSEDDLVVLHVGRFIEQKNHAGVLDVFTRVRARVPNAKLVLLGQGPLKDEILARIEREGLGPSVRFLGLRDDVPAIMTVSDVFLFPSLDEGFGLAALEANAAGIPVVGTAIDGLDEAVVDGQTARLFSVRDVDAMAEATIAFALDPAQRAAFGLAGRERAQREYSHAASARKMLAVYRDAIRIARGGV
ncbi:MAG: glycosyltransferase family 4 protein [Myxococcales bacterium]|nr:glycosyltransferase family 4 protein [Myxococcales bacterium]